MKRKQWIVLIGCLLSCLIILLTLYATSPISKEIKRNSFERIFAHEGIILQKEVLDIEYNSFYIAGATKDKIYLGNATAPFHLLITNTILSDSQHVILKVKLDSIKEPRRFKLKIDSPYFFLVHGTMPELLRGKINQWEAKRFMPDTADYFVEAVPIGSSSFAFRSYSTSEKGYELAKKSITTPFKFQHDLLQKQIDGLFCVDGELHYNKELNRLVYLHYYRNEIIVADSNLNLIYRGHTIDTLSHAKIKVSKIGNQNQSMLSAPPRQTNARSCVYGNFLFVQSNLLAKNEDMEKFLSGSVVDIYDLIKGTYLYSFYIKDYQGNKPSDFKIYKKHLVVIFDHFLIMYEINQDLFHT